jgi:hypothetical protein
VRGSVALTLKLLQCRVMSFFPLNGFCKKISTELVLLRGVLSSSNDPNYLMSAYTAA